MGEQDAFKGHLQENRLSSKDSNQSEGNASATFPEGEAEDDDNLTHKTWSVQNDEGGCIDDRADSEYNSLQNEIGTPSDVSSNPEPTYSWRRRSERIEEIDLSKVD